jgi:hypothetical protein
MGQHDICGNRAVFHTDSMQREEANFEPAGQRKALRARIEARRAGSRIHPAGRKTAAET